MSSLGDEEKSNALFLSAHAQSKEWPSTSREDFFLRFHSALNTILLTQMLIIAIVTRKRP